MPIDREPNISSENTSRLDDAVLTGDIPANLAGVTELLARTQVFFAHFPERFRDRILIIAEEIVINIVSHGNAPPGSRIKYRFDSGPLTVRMSFSDHGIAFDPRSDLIPPRDETPELVAGGLGWPLVLSWGRIVDYQRTEGQNHLELDFPLSPESDPAGD